MTDLGEDGGWKMVNRDSPSSILSLRSAILARDAGREPVVAWSHLSRLISRNPLTKEGTFALLLILGLLTIGLIKNINLLTLLACFLLAFLLFNVLWAKRQLRGLQGRRLIVGPVFARTPVTVVLELWNPRRRKRSGVKVIDQGPEHQIAWFVPALASGAT